MRCPNCKHPRTYSIKRHYVNDRSRVNYKYCRKCGCRFGVLETVAGVRPMRTAKTLTSRVR